MAELLYRLGRGAARRAWVVFAAWIALIYPIAWLSLLTLLAGLPALLIVWTYRQPRELVIALGLTSLTALGYAGFLYWAFVG